PLQCLLADPPFSQDPRPALAISTHFFQKGKSILISYLDSREIVAWTISPWKKLWRQKFSSCIGSSAYSDSLGSLLVWNLEDGINVYRLTDNPTCHLLLVRMLHMKIRRNRICDVQFDSTGEFAISGSDNGEVHLWNIDSGQLDQALCHGRGKNQLNEPSMTYCLVQNGRHFIASGSSEHEDWRPYIKIWSSQVVRGRLFCTLTPCQLTD
ncbi:hypothetical protein BD769DRAFT_1371002, partial [Suillus cothurnatus]